MPLRPPEGEKTQGLRQPVLAKEEFSNRYTVDSITTWISPHGFRKQQIFLQQKKIKNVFEVQSPEIKMEDINVFE